MEKLIQFWFQHGGWSSCRCLGGRQAAASVCGGRLQAASDSLGQDSQLGQKGSFQG